MDIKDLSKAEVVGDYLIVKLWPPEKQTKGGILMPQQFAKTRAIADVIAVGQPDSSLHANFVPGDVIVAPAHELEDMPELGTDIRAIRMRGIRLVYPQEQQSDG